MLQPLEMLLRQKHADLPSALTPSGGPAQSLRCGDRERADKMLPPKASTRQVHIVIITS